MSQGSIERSPDFSEAFHFHSILNEFYWYEYCIHVLLYVFTCECIHKLEDVENYFGFLKCDHLPKKNALRHNSWGQNFCRRKAQVLSLFPISQSLDGQGWTFNGTFRSRGLCSVLGTSPWCKLRFSSTMGAPNQVTGTVESQCSTKDEWKVSDKRLHNQGNN